jgi:hypothetical protein
LKSNALRSITFPLLSFGSRERKSKKDIYRRCSAGHESITTKRGFAENGTSKSFTILRKIFQKVFPIIKVSNKSIEFSYCVADFGNAQLFA